MIKNYKFLVELYIKQSFKLYDGLKSKPQQHRKFLLLKHFKDFFLRIINQFKTGWSTNIFDLCMLVFIWFTVKF
jgi:hypothetical protein